MDCEGLQARKTVTSPVSAGLSIAQQVGRYCVATFKHLQVSTRPVDVFHRTLSLTVIGRSRDGLWCWRYGVRLSGSFGEVQAPLPGLDPAIESIIQLSAGEVMDMYMNLHNLHMFVVLLIACRMSAFCGRGLMACLGAPIVSTLCRYLYLGQQWTI
jgi:hypothetical protein